VGLLLGDERTIRDHAKFTIGSPALQYIGMNPIGIYDNSLSS